MLCAVDADLPVFGLHDHAGIGQTHKGRVIGADTDQRFRELGADARAGGLVVNTMFDDAEAVFADGPVQRGQDFRAGLDGFGQAQRVQHVAAPAVRFKRVGHDRQRRNPRAFGHGAQVSVDRRIQRLPVKPPPVRRLVGLDQARQAGIVDPQVTGIGARYHPSDPAHCIQVIAHALALARGVQHHVDLVLPRRMPPADTGRLLPRRVDVAVRQKAELGASCFGRSQHARIRRRHFDRNRTLIRCPARNAAFRKTGIGTLVVGEGPAGLIRKARALTGLESGVEQWRQVGTEKINVHGDGLKSLGNGRLRRGTKRQNKCESNG